MVFLSFFGFCVDKFKNWPFWEVKIFFLEIGHIGYQQIENFILISKMQTYLSDKMPPKKVKIKKRKKMGLSKVRKQFFKFNFFGGHFVTKTSLLLWNQFKILDFFYTCMTYFKKTNFHLSAEPIINFLTQKSKKDRNTTKYRKMPFLK